MRSETATQLRHYLLILLAGAMVFFIGLGGSKLWDEDESEYTRCAREMMARGDWVVPTFNHQPWLEKPVLLYWLMIGSFHLFGPTEFAARFPSAIFAIGTSLMTYHLGRRLFRPQVGLWAGLILATSLMFVVVARAATFDSTLIFFTTLSLLAYVIGMGQAYWHVKTGSELFDPHDSRVARFRAVLPRSWWGFVAMYVPMGLAVMVKGPLGVLLPVAAIGMFVWISGTAAASGLALSSAAAVSTSTEEPRRLRLWMGATWQRLKLMAADFPAAAWAMRPLTLAAIVMAISAPWYILVDIQTDGDFFNVFIWQHNVQYILHSHQGHAGSTLYYYPIALVIGFFPWTIALALGAIAIVRQMRRQPGNHRASVLALTWGLTWLVVMSLVGTKLPHYIVPAYPMLAVITGLWIANSIAAKAGAISNSASQFATDSKRVDRWMAAGHAGLALLGIAVAIALPLAMRRWIPGQPSCYWLGIILALGGAIGWLFQRRRQPAAVAITLIVTAGALYLGIFSIAAPHFSRQQTSIQMTDAIERLGTKSTPIGLCRLYLPGFIYYADRSQPILGLGKPDVMRKLTDANGDFLIVTDLPGLIELRPQLPVDAVVLEHQTRFLKGYDLFVIGRQRAEVPIVDANTSSASAHAGAAGAKLKR